MRKVKAKVKVIEKFVESIEFGEMRSFRNIAVLPLYSKKSGSTKYITLKEADKFFKRIVKSEEEMYD